jgi:NAD-dependent DNA ligase
MSSPKGTEKRKGSRGNLGSPKNNTKRKLPKTIMQEFKAQGLPALEKLTKIQLNNVIKEANKEYHAYQTKQKPPTLTDAEFDIVKEYLESKYPDADALQLVGAEVPEKMKVTLPINMPSMDKIKPDSDALSQWCKKYKGPYVLSCKLDGVSGLYYSVNNTRKLYTRGNGTVGQDISHLLKPLSSTIPNIPDVIVRGEFIVSKTKFETSYKSDFANIRNMVAGIINRKSIDKKAKDVDFVAYEVIQPVLPPSEQMKFLTEKGFNTVQNITKRDIDNEFLSNRLIDLRSNYSYEIDGIIVSDDKVHPRVQGNPDHAFAFKMVISDQMAETQVVDVIWTASKDGYLKPRVQINPVHIGGVKIEFATGFNGQYIESNKIGVGAVIKIVRSGDVIPYIKSITTAAETAKMPSVPYTWTDTHVDIMLANKKDDPVVLEKQITAFFTGLDVDGLSIGNVKRLIQGGYNSVAKILHMQLDHFKALEGFQEKMSLKIYNSIREKIETASLVKIMAASGVLGRGLGERKLKPILTKYPTIVTSSETANEKIAILQMVDGIGKENANTFVSNIPAFLTFMAECELMDKLQVRVETIEPVVESSHPLSGKKIVFTGFRDKPYMESLEKKGIVFASTISKNVVMVVVKDKTEKNAKIEAATKLNIPIVSIQEFKEKY